MDPDSVTLKGIVRGKTIELDRSPGLPDGQEVTITVQAPAQSRQKPAAGEGLKRSAGAWGDDIDGLDEYLAWTRQQRKLSRRGPESRASWLTPTSVRLT